MRIRSVILLGIIVMLLCTNALAYDKGSIQVFGMGSVVVPADMVNIVVRAQSNGNNTTQALIANGKLLDKTKEALIAAGMNESYILPGYSSRQMTYHESFCSNENNTTTCRYETSHIVTSQMTIRMKQDKEMINKTIDVAKSSGAMAAITGYSIGDIQAVVDEVRKKAMENAQQNAQDSASAYGFTLGKIIGITESPGSNIEISRPRSLLHPSGLAIPLHSAFGGKWIISSAERIFDLEWPM
jgi:uncharacterized protein YggE